MIRVLRAFAAAAALVFSAMAPQQPCAGCPASWNPTSLTWTATCCNVTVDLSATSGLCNYPPGCTPGPGPCKYYAKPNCTSGTCYVFVQAGGTYVPLPCGVTTYLGPLDCYNNATVTFAFADCLGNNTSQTSTATCGVCPGP